MNNPPERISISGGSGTATPMEPAAVSVTSVLDDLNPGESTDVTATVYDDSGNTIAGVEVVFTLADPTTASITHIVITSELGEATATLTARDLPGEIQITASSGFVLNDPTKRVIITGTPDPAAGDPAAIYVAAALDTLNPGISGGLGESTDITAIVYDASGDPVSGVEVLFSLDDPTMATITSNAVTSASGAAIVTLWAKDLAGEVSVTATAGTDSVQNTPAARITISGEPVTTVPAEPEAVAVAAALTSVSTGDETQITATVYDESGHTIAGIEVVFSLDDPTIASVTHAVITSASGEATATFTAGSSSGSVIITATAGSPPGDSQETITITIL